MSRILVVDDDPDVLDAMTSVIESMGHQSVCADSASQATAFLQSNDIEVVLLDVRLPDADGLDLLPEIRQMIPAPEVVIMTGYGDPDGAELAIKNGAWDYIEKPSSLKRVKLTLSRALHYQQEKRSRATKTELLREGIVGESPQITECLDIM
jgi:two-component system NtrC family response regulator